MSLDDDLINEWICYDGNMILWI